MMQKLLILVLVVFYSCTDSTVKTGKTINIEVKLEMKPGVWRLLLDIEKDKLPFNFEYSTKDGKNTITITNAEERIEAINVVQKGDSVYFETPVFPSKFFGKIISPTELSGYWINYGKSPEYRLNFTAQHGEDFRFEKHGKTELDLPKKWEVHFSPNSKKDTYNAIGLFTFKSPNIVYGTFATETGDYRFLEGNLVENQLNLSCFDGSHAFLFKATLKGNKLLDGMFYSGKHWEEPWEAIVNPEFQLNDPDLITKVVKGEKWQKIKVRDSDENQVSFEDMSLDNKVTIIQILGSWCPNCIDESRYYTSLYDKFHDDGLEIIGVAFEKKDVGLINIERIKKRIGIPYEIYLGGDKSKVVADSLFTIVDNISSFPTSIIIDKKGNIRRIHTGFYGPGTGEYYTEYVSEMDAFIVELIEE